MIKKGSILLLALLVLAPGCFKNRKGAKAEHPKKTKKVAQIDDFSQENMPLVDASDDLEIDDSVRQFFDDYEKEFVAFSDQDDDETDLDLMEADASDAGDKIKKEEFAWADVADEENKLETVYFGFNEKKIGDDEKDKIELNVEKAKKLLADAKADGSDAMLVVEGHACGSAGSDDYNKGISERRAKEVTGQLLAAGIEAADIKMVSYGNKMLVVKEGSREEQWPNRRVELFVSQS